MKKLVPERLSPKEMEALLIAVTLYVVGDNESDIDRIAEMAEVIATRIEEEENGETAKEN